MKTRCDTCGRDLLPSPDNEPFCDACARQSIWQRTWSVFSPAASRDEWVWRGRAAIAVYLFVTGWLLLFAMIRSVGGLKDMAGGVLLFTALYAVAAMGVGFLVPRLLPRSARGRWIVAIIAGVASIVVWVVVLAGSGGSLMLASLLL